MSESIIKTISFHSAPEFLNALRRSHPQWEGDTGLDTGWVFRGQADSAWHLVPRAFRADEEKPDSLLGGYLALLADQYREQDWLRWAAPGINRPRGVSSEQWHERVRSAALRALTHAMMIRNFVLLANSAGHRVETPDVLWHLGNEDQEALRMLFHGREKLDPVFAIAQHHGIPTGLLDWTYNPLVAAYFAAERPAGSSIAVWALRIRAVWHDVYLRRLTVPPQVIPFLDAQEGLFTWCPTAYLFYLIHGRFPTINEMVKATSNEVPESALPRPILVKLTLPADQTPELLRLLWREKVSPAHLMPTFDNVTRALTMQKTLFPKGFNPPGR